MDADTHITADESPAIQPYYAGLAAQDDEKTIAHDIESMWIAHRSMQSTANDYRKQLQLLGTTLGEALYSMKNLLARPGRNGKWSEFLREKKIPRTSGDRLVNAYARSLHPASCTDGAIQSPTPEEVKKLYSAVWSRVSRKLSTPESLFWFICDIATMSGVQYQLQGCGILILESANNATDEVSTAVVGQTAAERIGEATEPDNEP